MRENIVLKRKAKLSHQDLPTCLSSLYFPSGCVAQAIDSCALRGRWLLAQHKSERSVDLFVFILQKSEAEK